MFPKIPRCEVCKENPALFFSADYESGRWSWICKEADCPEGYWISFEDIFKSAPATVDWLAHLTEKSWFKHDEFFKMMERFREATGSFNQ